MKDKVFLDTNIFVYAIDSSPELIHKRDIARGVIREQIENESGVISLSFWDALILQAAKSVECSELLSEDLQPDFHVDGLVVKNPFSI